MRLCVRMNPAVARLRNSLNTAAIGVKKHCSRPIVGADTSIAGLLLSRVVGPLLESTGFIDQIGNFKGVAGLQMEGYCVQVGGKDRILSRVFYDGWQNSTG